MTNFEKLKNMTIKEAAEFLKQVWFGDYEHTKAWLERDDTNSNEKEYIGKIDMD